MGSDCTYCAQRLYVEDGKTLTECTLSNGKPCMACERQTKLRERIAETKKLLDALIVEEREARTEINRNHDPFQVHAIPIEIASYIFRFVLPPFTLQKQSYVRGRPTREIYRGLDALTLGAVCRAWRQRVWSMPHLWSDVMLTLHREPTRNMVNVMKEWLERSKPLPLNIRLFLAEVKNYSKTVYEQEDNPRCDFEDLIKLSDKHSARWKTLSVQSPALVSRSISGDGNGAPLLSTLQILNFETDDKSDDDDDDSGKFLLKGPMPQPTVIDVSSHPQLTSLAISWTNVTHATLHTFDLNFYVKLLQNAPRLVSLHLDRAFFHRAPIIPNPPIQHKLQILYIYAGYKYTDDKAVNFYSVIFDSVTLPSLKDLTLKGPESGPLNKLQEFLERSSPPLTNLEIQTDCDQQEALDLLYSLPSLKFVTLGLQTLNGVDFDLDSLFEHLTYAPIITDATPKLRPQLLPNLAGFDFILDKWVAPEIPWGRLPSLRRPLSGKPERPHLQFISFRRQGGGHPQVFPVLHKSDTNLDESAIRGLIGLLDDGVELYLPKLVSREDLLALLDQ